MFEIIYIFQSNETFLYLALQVDIKSNTNLIIKRSQVAVLSANMNTIEWKFYMKLMKYHERPLYLNEYRGINKAIIHLKGKIHQVAEDIEFLDFGISKMQFAISKEKYLKQKTFVIDFMVKRVTSLQLLRTKKTLHRFIFSEFLYFRY